jgi:hypothetical protein
MAIPGYRWVRGLVPADVYEYASREKGGRTWDDHLAAVLRPPQIEIVDGGASAAMAAQPFRPPQTLVAAIVEDAPPRVSTERVEPDTQVDPWVTADEILRDSGEPTFQRGVIIGVGATLSGSAGFAIESA